MGRRNFSRSTKLWWNVWSYRLHLLRQVQTALRWVWARNGENPWTILLVLRPPGGVQHFPATAILLPLCHAIQESVQVDCRVGTEVLWAESAGDARGHDSEKDYVGDADFFVVWCGGGRLQSDAASGGGSRGQHTVCCCYHSVLVSGDFLQDWKI